MDEVRILLVGDSQDDADLLQRELSRVGISHRAQRVSSRQALQAALQAELPDLVITDYSLPGFNGMEVIRLVRKCSASLPLIVLTASLSAEMAVACLKAGATDYVTKQNMARMPFSVRETLEQSHTQELKTRAEADLHERNRELSHTILKQLGYQVLLAEDGERALQIGRAQGARIRLLVSDVVMPKMSGTELAEALRGICPDLRVLLGSGYNTALQDGLAERDVAFLQKPFTAAQLAAKVRETLDR
jgi:CheY-like chemotaxis protein